MKTSLDRIDIDLLVALQKNGRASNKELAALVGLAPSTTHSRVQRLLAQGLVDGVHAMVQPRAMGANLQALVFVRLKSQHHDKDQQIWEKICQMPQLRTAFSVGGSEDLVLHVVSLDTVELRDQLLDPLSAHPSVMRVRTELVFDSHYNPVLPLFSAD